MDKNIESQKLINLSITVQSLVPVSEYRVLINLSILVKVQSHNGKKKQLFIYIAFPKIEFSLVKLSLKSQSHLRQLTMEIEFNAMTLGWIKYILIHTHTKTFSVTFIINGHVH